VCAACSLKVPCTTNRNSRSLRRSPRDQFIDIVRAYERTEPYQKVVRKRQGVNRAFVRRGQALARYAPLPDEDAREGQHRSLDDSHRPEHEAPTDLRR
jgi:hypothetical protein